MNVLTKYNKTIVIVVGVIVWWLTTVYGGARWLQGVELILSALGVFSVPNTTAPTPPKV